MRGLSSNAKSIAFILLVIACAPTTARGGAARPLTPPKSSSEWDNKPPTQRLRTQVNFQLPRFNLHDAVAKIVEQTGINIVAESYFKPRPGIAMFNVMRRPFRLRAESVEDALKQLGDLFDYRWKKEGNIYILQNKFAYADAPYRVPALYRDAAEANHGNMTFNYLCRFINLTPQQIESLAEQHPEFNFIKPGTLRRPEIEAYLALPEAMRKRLDKGEKVKWSEIPANAQEKVTALVRRKVRNVTPEQMKTTLHWLEKNRWGEQMWTFSGDFGAK
jgi:hypothetical protein